MSKRSDTSAPGELAGYEVLVCVCGGIAAYKVCDVVSKLVQRGAGVTVAMTDSAEKFVGPVTFQALTGRRVARSLWAPDEDHEVGHIGLSEAADLLLIAPATANIIGKIVGGIADDLVSTLITSAASPVVLAPTMNARMWANPIVQGNVARLAEMGYAFVGPEEGWLACRSVGPGRMSDPAGIVDVVVKMLTAHPPKVAAGEA